MNPTISPDFSLEAYSGIQFREGDFKQSKMIFLSWDDRDEIWVQGRWGNWKMQGKVLEKSVQWKIIPEFSLESSGAFAKYWLSCAYIGLPCTQPRKAWLWSYKLNNFQMMYKVRRQSVSLTRQRRKSSLTTWGWIQKTLARVIAEVGSIHIENTKNASQIKPFRQTKPEITCLLKICTKKKKKI